MRPIVKFGLTKAGIRSNLHTSFIYGPRSLRSIGLFHPVVIQWSGWIAFIIKHYYKNTPYIQIIRANLYTLQLEARIGGNILAKNYTETQKWLQIESWILEVWKCMSTNQIKIYHLVTEVSTKRMHDACLMTHLALKGDFATSELRAINWCCMSNSILFISDISNHQGNILSGTVANFNLIHEFNWPRKHHTTTA